ncbi:MAG: nucleoside triphosphate pyrophosphohydrolase family protein [Candidatus Saccharimonadales bacterium]
MTFDEYQKQALTTDVFANQPGMRAVTNPAYIAKILGLVGESGEVAEKYKKIIRDSREVSQDDRRELLKELGDVLWYIATLAHYLDSDFDSVATNNLAKLADRQARNVIKAKGDNR